MAHAAGRDRMSAEFPTTDWIWRDGELIPWDDAQLHVMSHVVHYGSSIFEGIRSYRTSTGAASASNAS